MAAKRVVNKGDKFGKLSVIKELPSKKGKRIFLFKCECGEIKSCPLGAVVSGNTTSCGCKRSISNTRHGYTKTHPRLYRIYKNMVARCNNRTSTSYYKYGAIGVEVCKEWKDSISTFVEWAILNGYKDTLTIDRIDNTKGYTPDNCRWVSTTIQNRNILRMKMGETGARGIHKSHTKGRYRATISVNNKSITIGTSSTINGAVKLRNKYIDDNNLTHIKSETL